MIRNLQSILDEAPLTGMQIRVVLLVAGALILEGIDIQMAAFAAPAITREWQLDASALGPILAAVMAGMALGGIFGGMIGDRWGRRPTLIAAIGIFGLTTACASAVTEVWHLAALRFVAGVGFGAAYPNAAVLVGEWSPLKVRAKAVTLLTLGLPIGGLLGSAASSVLIPSIGWRATFLAAGILPLIIAVIMLFGLLESPSFLARNPAKHPTIIGWLSRLTSRDVSASDVAMLSDGDSKGRTRWNAIFVRENWRVTGGFWLAFLANFTVAYLVINWLPMLLSLAGLDEANAIRGSFYMNLAGIVGLVVSAVLYQRLGSKKAFSVMLILPSLAVLLVALLTLLDVSLSNPVLILAGACLAYFAVGGATACLWSLSVHAYSVATRATGLGWSNSIGRLGGVVSTLIGGALIQLQPSPFVFLVFLALVLVIEMAGVLLIDRQAPPVAEKSIRRP